MILEPEALYAQIGYLVQSMPDLDKPFQPDVTQWLGKVFALVQETKDTSDANDLKIAMKNLTSPMRLQHNAAKAEIEQILYRALAVAELQAPATSRGAFIPAGNAFDALAAVGKVLQSATRTLMIVDPYMDEKALTTFGILAPEAISLNLLSDQQSHKASLQPAVQAWRVQYPSTRPLEMRLTSARQLHDRLIIVDDDQVWILTQSLNAFAVRAPASIVRVDSDTAELKVGAYKAIWEAAII